MGFLWKPIFTFIGEIMKSFGHINMQQNQLQETVIAVENQFPSLPVPGRLVFANQRLYICVSIESGTPIWIPLTKEVESYEFAQNEESLVWTINHNLHTTLPSVQVYGPDQRAVIPDDIEVVTNDQIKVTFGRPTTGRAIVLVGATTGAPRPVYSYEHTQANSSATWVIPHALGYNPVVRVFIGQEEVQPVSIVHDSNFQVTVTFTQAYVGIARLI